MNKKKIAREVLLFFSTLVLILVIFGFWYLFTNNQITSKKRNSSQIGFNDKLYQNIQGIDGKEKFKNVIEIYDKEIFLKTILDTTINRKLYNKAKELELYLWNGKLYSKEFLKKQYGEKTETALQKYGFKKTNYLTDLSYEDFNFNIQNDKDSWKNFLKNSKKASPTIRNYKKDISIIALFFFTIVYPIRLIYFLINWSISELKK